jgi:hypothetical protein
VISDVELLGHGTKLLFVLDTYDVVENYLPYTEMELFSKGQTNQLAQRFLCYDHLFGSFNKTKILVPNEYRIELLAAKNRLQWQLREATVVLNNLSKLKKSTPDFLDFQKTSDFFKKHFEIILLLLIMSNKKAKILDEFLNFLRDRLVISDVKFDTEDSEEVNEIFKSSKATEFSVELYDQYVESNRLLLASIENEIKRQRLLENTSRDIQVIERIMKINKALRDKGLKYFVIYISSAGKTPNLFNLLRKSKGLDAYSPQELSFNRNIFQYFLMDKLVAEYRHDIPKLISKLKSIKEAKKALGDSVQIETDPLSKQTLDEIGKVLEDGSSSLDNHFYLSIFSRYKKIFTDSQPDIQVDGEEITRILKEIDGSQDLGYDIANMEYSLSEVNQSIVMSRLINNFERRVSKDIIRNSYQHLPILLFYNDFNSNLSEPLYSLVNMIIEIDKSEKQQKNQIRNNLLNTLNQILLNTNIHRTASSRLSRLIVISYISLLMNNENQDEESLITEFTSYLVTLKGVNTTIDLKQTLIENNIKFDIRKDSLALEISYILIWLYRRNNREDVAISIGTDLLKDYSSEPRLLHGVGLSYLVKAYNQTNRLPSRAVIEIFQTAEQYLTKSLQNFDSQFDRFSPSGFGRALQLKTLTAILNSLINIKMRIFELIESESPDILLDGLGLLNQIKEIFIEMEVEYNNHVTYLGTELELLYHLSSYYKFQNNFTVAREYIIRASLLYLSLKNLDEYKFLDVSFKNRFEKIPELMNQLMLKK